VTRFEVIKQIEDDVLAFGLENVKTYVIATGILYGSGEDALENFYKVSWLQNPEKLPYPGTGENMVPAIHVKDLATFILKIADTVPEQKYHFAFDGNKDRTIKSLITSISKSTGSGKVESLPSVDLIKQEHSYLFSMDIWSLPSDLLIAPPPPEEDKEASHRSLNGEAPEPIPEAEDPEFEWHSKRGIAEEGRKILIEFTTQKSMRRLTQNIAVSISL
jgi:hypothetical protein